MTSELTRVERSLREITHSGSLNHVPHSEALNRLVLGNTARAIRAAHKADVAAAMFVATVVPPLLSLQNKDV